MKKKRKPYPKFCLILHFLLSAFNLPVKERPSFKRIYQKVSNLQEPPSQKRKYFGKDILIWNKVYEIVPINQLKGIHHIGHLYRMWEISNFTKWHMWKITKFLHIWHVWDVENVHFMLFCCKIDFVTICVFCQKNSVCRDLRTSVWRKMTNMRYAQGCHGSCRAISGLLCYTRWFVLPEKEKRIRIGVFFNNEFL